MNDQRRPSWPGDDPDGRQGRPAAQNPGGAHRHRSEEPQPGAGTHGSIQNVLGGGATPNGNGSNTQQPGRPVRQPVPTSARPVPPPWQRQAGPAGQQQPPRGPQQPPRPGGRPNGYAPPPIPPVEGETELLPLVDEDKHYDDYREPELLTHRDGFDDFDEEPLETDGRLNTHYLAEEDEYADEEPEPEAGDDPEPPQRPRSTSLERARMRRKRRWKRIRRGVYIAAAVLIIGPILGFFIAYQVVDVPSPEEAQAKLAQPVNYYFADKSLITTDKTDGGNRTILKPNQITDTVKHATEAAEDASFETNSGFDIKGILGAVWKQVSGRQGGGSTISQQYVKQATGNDQHSYWRKAIELVQSFKMTNEQSKQDIITAYLNTIYFGRGAYGIQAAAKAYFNTDAEKLSKPQAAMLAGLIQGPGRSENEKYRVDRANYVMNQMVDHKWMTKEERAQATLPTPIEAGSNKQETQLQKNPYLLAVKRQIDSELESKGLDANQLRHSGAKIYTTINPKVQQMAVDANNKIMSANKNDKNLVSGQVSVDPKTGSILAYYPGQRDKTQYDQAAQAHQPGSSFKPFTFLSLLENRPGAGLGSTFDGTDNQVIKGTRVHNADEESCGTSCTVKQAMTESVNTVFYNIAAQIGTQKVRDAAWQAGISKTTTRAGCENVPSLTEVDPKTCKPKEIGGGIALGQYPVSVKDMAQAYATFFNNGMFIPAHFVSKVTDSSGEDTLYQAQTAGKPAFDKNDPKRNAQLASTVLDSMKDVLGYSGGSLGGRPNATKTGTAQAYAAGDEGSNTAAWMAGGTPQVVSAVYVGDKRNSGKAIHGNYSNPKGSSTNYDIYGREEPTFIWQEFSKDYLQGKPVEQLSEIPPMGEQSSYSFSTYTPSTQTNSSNDQTNATDETTRSRHRRTSQHTTQNQDTSEPDNNTGSSPPTHGGGGGDTGGGDTGGGGGGHGGGTDGGGTGGGGGGGGDTPGGHSGGGHTGGGDTGG